MPKNGLDTKYKRFNANPNKSFACENQLMEDNPLSDSFSTAAWELCSKESPKKIDGYRITKSVNQREYETQFTNWTASEDPLTQNDLIHNEDDQVQELIYWIKTSTILDRESFTNKLINLFNDAKEEDPDSPGIALCSIRNFVKFLQLKTDLTCPFISLTPDNYIFASWRGEKDRVFSVLFLPKGNVRFVIFKPNTLHPERQIIISGTATTDTLMETVTPHGILKWILAIPENSNPYGGRYWVAA